MHARLRACARARLRGIRCARLRGSHVVRVCARVGGAESEAEPDAHWVRAAP